MNLKSFLFLFIAPVFAFAQSNYKPGYVVKNSGDTVKGYINYREWENSPKSIEFKDQLQSKEVINFTPSTIKSFTIDKLENYISYSGLISMDKITFPDLSYEMDTARVVDTVYLRVLTAGPNVSLLLNRDKIRTRFFFKEAGNSPQELIYHQYYLDGQNVHETKMYTGQLIMLLHKYRSNDEKDERKVWNIRFNEIDLVKAINIINNHQESSINNSSSNNRFFITLGANYSRIKFQGENTFTNPTSNKASFSPYLGLGVDVFNNPNVQKFALRAELSFSHSSGNVTITESTSGFYTPDISNYKMEQYTASLCPQLIYNLYNANLFKFYLGVGAGLNFSIYPTNTLSVNGTNYTNNKAYELKHYWTSFPFEAGASLNKKIEVFFMYLKNTSFTDYVYYSISTDNFNAGIRYHFTRSK